MNSLFDLFLSTNFLSDADVLQSAVKDVMATIYELRCLRFHCYVDTEALATLERRCKHLSDPQAQAYYTELFDNLGSAQADTIPYSLVSQEDLIKLCQAIDEFACQPWQAFYADLWENVLALVTPFSDQALFRQQGQLIKIENNIATVKVSSQLILKMATRRIPNLEDAFSQVMDSPIAVDLSCSAT